MKRTVLRGRKYPEVGLYATKWVLNWWIPKNLGRASCKWWSGFHLQFSSLVLQRLWRELGFPHPHTHSLLGWGADLGQGWENCAEVLMGRFLKHEEERGYIFFLILSLHNVPTWIPLVDSLPLFKPLIWAAEVKYGPRSSFCMREVTLLPQHPRRKKSIKTAFNPRSRENQRGGREQVAVSRQVSLAALDLSKISKLPLISHLFLVGLDVCGFVFVSFSDHRSGKALKFRECAGGKWPRKQPGCL